MRSDRRAQAVALAAALLMGASTPPAGLDDGTIWIELCDPGHPGAARRVPLRRDGGDHEPSQMACHGPCPPAPRRHGART